MDFFSYLVFFLCLDRIPQNLTTVPHPLYSISLYVLGNSPQQQQQQQQQRQRQQDEEDPQTDQQQELANFGLSGKLAKDQMTGNVYRGVVLKVRIKELFHRGAKISVPVPAVHLEIVMKRSIMVACKQSPNRFRFRFRFHFRMLERRKEQKAP